MEPKDPRLAAALAATQSFDDDAGLGATDAAPASEPVRSVGPEEPTLIGQRIGQFQVVRELGRGGMGLVYEAVHASIGQRVAVKTLNKTYAATPEYVQRFFNEAKAMTIAQHPSLVKVFDCGQLPDGELYILMEYLDGESLRSRITQRGARSAEEAIRIGRQVAAAMAYAHERGIIHRDLKPENIFIVPDPEAPSGERAKILDFGLAKIRSPLATSGQQVGKGATDLFVIMGTPGYMAPEQCRGLSGVGRPADVYSLGVILFELVVGRPPFSGSSVDVLLEKTQVEEPPSLRSVGKGVPRPLAALVARMLKKRADGRPTMIEAEAALLQIDTGRGTPASRSTPPRSIPVPGAGPWLSKLGIALGAAALLGAAVWGAVHVLGAGRRGPHSGMARIPGGTFSMGSTTYEVRAATAWCKQLKSDGCVDEQFERELPQRSVRISDFYLDRTEVNNEQFAAWMNQQRDLVVDKERLLVHRGTALIVDLYATFGQGGLLYKGDRIVPLSGYEHRPVTQVTWHGARAFCAAAGKRLPTEAEWEYAARSGGASRFPWGDDEPRCDGVVFARRTDWQCGSAPPGTVNVGTSSQDRSVHGVFDLAGNVSEWVEDAFLPRYPACPGTCQDPLVPAAPSGSKDGLGIIRGGDWSTAAVTTRAAARSRIARERTAGNLGFRCALTVR